jgi:tRNA threonylcarbamoyladenosine biosynthesis protein TsaB
MIILAVDTASKSCSVAIMSEHSILSEITIVTQKTHSRYLMEMIEFAIHRSGISKQDLDGYAVTKGPGSFTGLRIGISTMKGFSEATGKPIVGVSSLDALAVSFSFSAFPVCAMLDAKRGEVYYAWYHFTDGTMKKQKQDAVASPKFISADLETPCLLVGDGSEVYREVLMDQNRRDVFFSLPSQNMIRAAHVGYLGIEKIHNHDTLDTVLIPHYIRKCDAVYKNEC